MLNKMALAAASAFAFGGVYLLMGILNRIPLDSRIFKGIFLEEQRVADFIAEIVLLVIVGWAAGFIFAALYNVIVAK